MEDAAGANECVMLQRKLQELEAEITKLTCNSPSHGDTATRHQQLRQEIERRTHFLRNLLSAEMESHHEQPEYLRGVAAIFQRLEDDFFTLVAFHELPGAASEDSAAAEEADCSCIPSCFNEENNGEMVLGYEVTAEEIDCSCIDSCPNDENAGATRVACHLEGYRNSDSCTSSSVNEENDGGINLVEREQKICKQVEKKRKKWVAMVLLLFPILIMIVLVYAHISMDVFNSRDYRLDEFLTPT